MLYVIELAQDAHVGSVTLKSPSIAATFGFCSRTDYGESFCVLLGEVFQGTNIGSPTFDPLLFSLACSTPSLVLRPKTRHLPNISTDFSRCRWKIGRGRSQSKTILDKKWMLKDEWIKICQLSLRPSMIYHQPLHLVPLGFLHQDLLSQRAPARCRRRNWVAVL